MTKRPFDQTHRRGCNGAAPLSSLLRLRCCHNHLVGIAKQYVYPIKPSLPQQISPTFDSNAFVTEPVGAAGSQKLDVVIAQKLVRPRPEALPVCLLVSCRLQGLP